jgi:hypothetical protein
MSNRAVSVTTAHILRAWARIGFPFFLLALRPWTRCGKITIHQKPLLETGIGRKATEDVWMERSRGVML